MKSKHVVNVGGRTTLAKWNGNRSSDRRLVEVITVVNPSFKLIDELLRYGDTALKYYKQRDIREERCNGHEQSLCNGEMPKIDCAVAVATYDGNRKYLVNGRTRLTAVKRIGNFKGILTIDVYECDTEEAIGKLCSVFDNPRFSRTRSEQMRFAAGKEINDKWTNGHFGRVHTAISFLLAGIPKTGKNGIENSNPNFAGITLTDFDGMTHTKITYGNVVSWFMDNFRLSKGYMCFMSIGMVTAIIHSKYVFGDTVVKMWQKVITGLDISKEEESLMILRNYCLQPTGQRQSPGGAAGQKHYYNMATWAFLAAKDVYGLRGTAYKPGMKYWMNSAPEIDKSRLQPVITLSPSGVKGRNKTIMSVISNTNKPITLDELMERLPQAGYRVHPTERNRIAMYLSRLAKNGILERVSVGTYCLKEEKKKVA